MPEREIMMEGQCLVLSLMLPVPILFMDVQAQYSRSLIRSTTSCGYDKSRRVATAAMSKAPYRRVDGNAFLMDLRLSGGQPAEQESMYFLERFPKSFP